MQIVKIYADGACSGNPGPGGWGVCIIKDGQQTEQYYGSVPMTTNNRMELTAAIQGLARLEEDGCAELYTDSQYVQLGMTKWLPNWIKRNWVSASNKPVKNVDLWQELHALCQRRRVSWFWVKGHADNKYNILADLLAVKGRDANITINN